MLGTTLSKISSQRHSSIIAGDFNIDLLHYHMQSATQEYRETVTGHNFMPLLILPTRITSKSSTLMDHIYYYEGKSDRDRHFKCGNLVSNLVSDVSDHLPNYF